MCAIAHATDGAGSIRYPAAYCGLFGLKPQRNRISLSPDREHWYGLSVSGCVSRTVMDTALYLDAMSGPEKGDFDSPPPLERPLVEAARTSPGQAADRLHDQDGDSRCKKAPEVLAAYEETMELLRSLGHEVTEAAPPLRPRWNRLLSRSTSAGSATRRSTLPHPERLSDQTQGLRPARPPVQRPRAWRRCADRMPGAHAPRSRRVFRDYDVLLTPATAQLPGRDRAAGAGRAPCGHQRDGQRLSLRVQRGTTRASRPATIPAGFTDVGPAALGDAGRPSEREDDAGLARRAARGRAALGRRPASGRLTL